MKKVFKIGLVLGIIIIMVALVCANNVGGRPPRDCQRSDLYAGKHIRMGVVHVWNIDSHLYVDYYSHGLYEITETHLAIGDELEDIPQTKKGNPKIGHFPYKGKLFFKIPLSEIDAGEDNTVYIAAHAVVGRWVGDEWEEETAWANTGNSFPGKSWALYFTYTLT